MPDFSKIGSSNVRKSKVHERRVAKLLEEFTGVEFRRRRVEGRDATTIERESTSDVIAVKGTPKFTIEAKSGKSFSMDALLANPRSCSFTEWWHQANYDAKLLTDHFESSTKYRFYPFVFFKPNANFDWVAFPLDVLALEVIVKKDSKILSHLIYNGYNAVNPVGLNVVRTKNKKNYKIVDLELPNVVFCRWRDFADAIDPTSFFY